MIPKEFNPNISHEYYFIRKAILNGISKHAHLLEGKLMDFGCGSKPYYDLFSNTKEYIGVDYNGEGHDHTTESIDVFYDGKTIPFGNNTFDSILSSEVFEHLFNLEEILMELNRVLKPGGKMLITCPFVWNLHEAPVDFARYTPYALRHLFNKYGFEVIVEDRLGTFVEVVVQMWNVYLLGGIFGYYNEKSYFRKRKFWSIFKPIVIPVHNSLGLLLNKLLPKRNDLFFNNLFVVVKK